MVKDPIPERAALGLVHQFCTLEITLDFMAFELGSKFNMIHILSRRSYRGEQLAGVVQ